MTPEDTQAAAKADNSNTISALQSLLFDAIRQVSAGTLDTDKARAINSLAGTAVDSARVLVDYRRTLPEHVGNIPFLEAGENGDEGTAQWPPGINSVTVHRLKG